MRKTAYALLAASALMTFIGAGCAGAQRTQVETGSLDTSGRMEANVNAKMDGAADIDAEVDAIIESERADEDSVETEADLMNGDKSELDAYSESSYEIK